MEQGLEIRTRFPEASPGQEAGAGAFLFFVQARRARESMAGFFDTLRAAARDALRVNLSLYYAEVPSADSIAESILRACLTRRVPSMAAPYDQEPGRRLVQE